MRGGGGGRRNRPAGQPRAAAAAATAAALLSSSSPGECPPADRIKDLRLRGSDQVLALQDGSERALVQGQKGRLGARCGELGAEGVQAAVEERLTGAEVVTSSAAPRGEASSTAATATDDDVAHRCCGGSVLRRCPGTQIPVDGRVHGKPQSGDVEPIGERRQRQQPRSRHGAQPASVAEAEQEFQEEGAHAFNLDSASAGLGEAGGEHGAEVRRGGGQDGAVSRKGFAALLLLLFFFFFVIALIVAFSFEGDDVDVGKGGVAEEASERGLGGEDGEGLDFFWFLFFVFFVFEGEGGKGSIKEESASKKKKKNGGPKPTH